MPLLRILILIDSADDLERHFLCAGPPHILACFYEMTTRSIEEFFAGEDLEIEEDRPELDGFATVPLTQLLKERDLPVPTEHENGQLPHLSAVLSNRCGEQDSCKLHSIGPCCCLSYYVQMPRHTV